MILRRPVFSATVPVTAASLFGERVDQKKALQRFAGNDEALDAFEIPAGLFVGVSGRAGRQRLEEAVAAATGVACDAAGVSFACARKYRKDASLEDLEVETRLHRGAGRPAARAQTATPQREATKRSAPLLMPE